MTFNSQVSSGPVQTACDLAALVKMQLDIDVSPPANIIIIKLTVTHVTFDLDLSDMWTKHIQVTLPLKSYVVH